MTAGQEHLTTGQAARLLKVTPDTVLKWIKSGRLAAAHTPGGHHRIARHDIEDLIPGPRQKSDQRAGELVYCWEYYADGGEVGPHCRECVVYRARALHCYEMSDLPSTAGFAGTYCKTSCEDCAYYQQIHGGRRKVLVVTDSVRLRTRLQSESAAVGIEVEFATCEYECSALVDGFRPQLVVIDCALPADTCTDLCSHLATDPRVPGVQIVLATQEGAGGDEKPAERRSNRLPRTFALADLEDRFARSRRYREVSPNGDPG